MSEFLFVTLDAGGNVPPALAIGRELLGRGHSVRVLGHESQRQSITNSGLEFRAYQRSPHWDPRADKGTLEGLRTLVSIFTASGLGQDMLDEVGRRPVDVVVIDCMLLGVLDAAERAGLMHVALFHSFYAYFDGPWRHGPIGMVSRLKGLGARRLWNRADLSLICTDRELDPSDRREEGGMVWTGPIESAQPPADDGGHARILASLSTIAFPGMEAVLQNIIAAADGLDAEMVVTTGPSLDPRRFSGGSNVTVHQFVPHDRLMSSCTAVVGHGGHSTTFKALAHDLPVLILPMHPMLDQPMVGKAVASAGAGISLKKSAGPDDIRSALRRLLDEASHRAAAARIGARMRVSEGGAVAAGRLEALLAHQR